MSVTPRPLSFLGKFLEHDSGSTPTRTPFSLRSIRDFLDLGAPDDLDQLRSRFRRYLERVVSPPMISDHHYYQNAASTRISPLEEYLTRDLVIPESRHNPDGVFSPDRSIRCLRDQLRTKEFLLGLEEAIHTLEASQSEIHVFDAGCGAVALFSIYAALCSDKVHCSALEFNAESVVLARQLVQRLGLQDRVEVKHGDATRFIPSQEIDILISETMDAGLFHEPMVQIMTHLTHYLSSRGIVLPHQVSVLASLVPETTTLHPRAHLDIGEQPVPVLDIEWTPVANYRPGDECLAIQFALDTSQVPEGIYHVMMSSCVEIMTSHRLRLNQSLITRPLALYNQESNSSHISIDRNDRPSSLRVSYVPGAKQRGKIARA